MDITRVLTLLAILNLQRCTLTSQSFFKVSVKQRGVGPSFQIEGIINQHYLDVQAKDPVAYRYKCISACTSNGMCVVVSVCGNHTVTKSFGPSDQCLFFTANAILNSKELDDGCVTYQKLQQFALFLGINGTALAEGYCFNYEDARKHCESLDAAHASLAAVSKAWQTGYSACAWGWVDGQTLVLPSDGSDVYNCGNSGLNAYANYDPLVKTFTFCFGTLEAATRAKDQGLADIIMEVPVE